VEAAFVTFSVSRVEFCASNNMANETKPRWSAEDDRMLKDFRMISPTESTIRKVVGALIELITLAALAFMPAKAIPYGLQNSLHSAAFVVYRMGVESQ